MIEYLATLFTPEQPDPGYDLSISGGTNPSLFTFVVLIDDCFVPRILFRPDFRWGLPETPDPCDDLSISCGTNP